MEGEEEKNEKVEYYGSPRWSGEIYDCSVPLTFDQYSKCSYRCLYCFSVYQKAVGPAKRRYFSGPPRPVNVDTVKRIFSGEPSQYQDYVFQRKVFQWGGLADPFCNYERHYGVGLDLLRFFREIDYPITFSTKGTWWTKDSRYVDLFRGAKNWNVKVSIITLDETKAKIIERGCPTVAERLDAIERIARLDCGGVTLRLRPFILGVTDPDHVRLVKLAAERGASAVSTEFLCAESRSRLGRQRLKVISECAGFDIYDFYRRYSQTTGYMRLNRNIKRPYVDDLERACKEVGIRFYVSDAHFKERCANGSCCGLPESWNYARGQFCQALMIAKQRGTVRWADIESDLAYAKKFPYNSAHGYNTLSAENRAKHHGLSMYDHIRNCWNDPSSGHSPRKMFGGILEPIGTDDENNVIYKFNDSKA